MRLFWILTFLWNLQAFAFDWNSLARFDQVETRESTFNSRFLFQSDGTFRFEKIQFYVDGFVEFEGASTKAKNWRRANETPYIREAYFEFQVHSLYFKIGRQSARWSDSWITPSLDVWTSRRLERLFLEPLSFQLSHSSGVFVTYVKPQWSIDASLIWDPSRDSYPQPYPHHLEPLESKSVNGGIRLKMDLMGVQSNWVAAQSLDQQTFGLGLNYAFEHWVPKLELGSTYNNIEDVTIINRNLNFASLGFDSFYENWTITPQITYIENETPYIKTDPQIIYYLLAMYDSNYHQFQIQGFINDKESNNYGSIEYTYKSNSNWSYTGFVQNYYGTDLTSLNSLIYNELGGVFLGVRLQYNLSSTR